MKMNVIANVGNPTEEKYCLCKDKYGYYAVALPSIINGRFSDWLYTEKDFEEEDIVSWIYIDDLNLDDN